MKTLLKLFSSVGYLNRPLQHFFEQFGIFDQFLIKSRLRKPRKRYNYPAKSKKREFMKITIFNYACLCTFVHPFGVGINS